MGCLIQHTSDSPRFIRLIWLSCLLITLLIPQISRGESSTSFSDTISLLWLEQHVRKLSADIGIRSVDQYPHLVTAADYIRTQLQSYGYQPELQEYITANRAVQNIIAVKSSSEDGAGTILIGAHYDSYQNPGADDNASGVAGLLEIARTLATIPTRHTVKFVAFTNEELPFFKTGQMGSRYYTRHAHRHGEKIRAALVLDMIGYYNDAPGSQRHPHGLGGFFPAEADFLAVVGNLHSRQLTDEIGAGFEAAGFPYIKTRMGGLITPLSDSDHWSFWKEKYPAVLISDTGIYRNLNYHRPTDTYEKLNYSRMAVAVQTLRGIILRLDARLPFPESAVGD